MQLDPDWQAYLEKLVAAGRYPSVEAALDDALTTLMHEERDLADLKRLIKEGLDSGPGVPFDEAFIEGVKQRGRERLAATKMAAE